MARPPLHDTGPLIEVRHHDDGVTRAVVWCHGVFTGDKEIRKHAEDAADRGQDYQLGSTWVTCDDSSPLGVTASLMHFAPGRMILQQAPDDVRRAVSIFESGLSYAGGEGEN